MKRVLKKVKLAPTTTTSENLVGTTPVQQKVYSRVRASAAMLGLAIMGASSLLLTQQSDRAAAAEPTVADPSVNETSVAAIAPNVPINMVTPTVARIASNGSVSLVSGLEAALKVKASEQSVVPATLAIPQSRPVVKIGETLGQTAPAYRLDVANNGVNTAAMQNLLPVAAVSSPVTVGMSSETINPQQTVIATAAPMTPASNADNVGAQLKAKQELALNRLKAKSNRLKESLAQLRTDETQKEVATVAPKAIATQPSHVVAVALNNTSPVTVAATGNVAKKVSFIGTAVQQTNVEKIAPTAPVISQSVSVPTAATALNPIVNKASLATTYPAANQQLLAQTPVDANSQNSPYVQSLRSEIDQLRAKYRAQEAGNANAPSLATETQKVATPVPAAVKRSQFANNQYLQLNNSPYSASQQAASQAVNPEFIPIQVPQVQRTPRTRMATAPMGVDASQTLGGM
ncbi:MAG: hypothetical protein H0X31_10680, partial [Nostocaceae cyanobacterium]|nr:hypothetical protein [Nostocaceae cyanobacterium]